MKRGIIGQYLDSPSPPKESPQSRGLPEYRVGNSHKAYISNFTCRCCSCRKLVEADEIHAVQERELQCLECANLEDLVFLHSGDQAVTNAVKARSPRFAVVLQITRWGLNRVGILVEPKAVAKIQESNSDLEGPFFHEYQDRWDF